MSDPVPNMEIEDVLSSIRRLVSADDRPRKPAKEVYEKPAEKLVLTPALRIDDLADDTPEQGDAEEVALSDEDAVTDVADASPAQGLTEPEPEQDETPINTSPMNDGEDTAYDESPASGDAGSETETLSESLTARAAELEAAVAAQDDQWEPDGTEPAEDAATPVQVLQWQDVEEEGEETEADMVAQHYQAEENEGLEAFAPEPDEAERTDGSSDHEAAENPAPNEPGNAFLYEEDLLADGDDAILDEETLRDLVAEIVRQELQGSLGERITRNVRKLVRREIQRALAAQELD